jgi:NADH:ubiquinone oxidoreductase subunit 3 (subunit A)
MAFSNVPSRDWVTTSNYLLLTMLFIVLQKRTMLLLVW